MPSGEVKVGAGKQAIHEAFATHAAAAPDAPAVLVDGASVSFGELDRTANRLAFSLRALEVTPEQWVAICARYSVDTLAAILAALKLGSPFVPIDPSDPAQRLEAVIDDAKPAVILAGPEDAIRFAGHEVLRIEGGGDGAGDPGPDREVRPDQPVCAYYTSGSGGEPTGVVLEQRGVLNHLHWVNRTMLGSRPLLLPLVNRLTFTASLKQLFAPWLEGRPVWLVEEGATGDPAALLELLTGHQVAFNCLPSLWSAMLDLVERGQAQVPKGVVSLAFSGVSPSIELLERTFSLLPQVEVWNLYGSTETTGTCVAARFRAGEKPRLGRPISNAEAHVLDDSLRPVPEGRTGELYLGGAGLARGYLERPELTAERFIPHPFAARSEERLFRTGDLARQLPDGGLEFAGRLDGLVKIRGFRVDPSEVEAAALKHPAVADVAVTADRDRRGRDRLIAHIVPRGDSPPTLADLRRHLGPSLPEYMLPSWLRVVERLPRTHTGKIARRALASPDGGRPSGEGAHVAPRTAVEEQVVEIWQEVLGFGPIGMTDDYFALGGDSLRAMEIVAELESRTGVRLPVSVLVEAATPERLAKLLRRPEANGRPSNLVALRQEGSRTPFFCVAPAVGSVIGLRSLALHLDSDRPVYALQSYADEGQFASSSIEAMAAGYVAAIRRVQAEGPYLLGGQCFGATIALEAALQLEAAGESVPVLAVIDGGAPRRLGAPTNRTRRPSKPVRPLDGPMTNGRRPPRGRRGSVTNAQRKARKRLRSATKAQRKLRKRLGSATKAQRKLRKPGRSVAKLTRQMKLRRKLLRNALASYQRAPKGGPGPLHFYRHFHRQRVGKGQAGGSYVAEPCSGRVWLAVNAVGGRVNARRVSDWEALAGGGFEPVMVPAPHVDLMREPAVADLGARLERTLQAHEVTT